MVVYAIHDRPEHLGNALGTPSGVRAAALRLCALLRAAALRLCVLLRAAALMALG